MTKNQWIEHCEYFRPFFPNPIDIPFMTLEELIAYTRNRVASVLEPEWESLHVTVAEAIARGAFIRGVIYE